MGEKEDRQVMLHIYITVDSETKQIKTMNIELYFKIKSKKEFINTINKISAYKVRQLLGIKCKIIIFCEHMDFNVWLISSAIIFLFLR